MSRLNDLALLLPCNRQQLTQLFKLQSRRLPAVEDHLDDVGSKEIEAQDIADIRRIDLFPLSGELLDRGIGALVKELLPSMRSRKRLQEHLVGVWGVVVTASCRDLSAP
jgi:hypothetical protein